MSVSPAVAWPGLRSLSIVLLLLLMALAPGQRRLDSDEAIRTQVVRNTQLLVDLERRVTNLETGGSAVALNAEAQIQVMKNEQDHLAVTDQQLAERLDRDEKLVVSILVFLVIQLIGLAVFGVQSYIRRRVTIERHHESEDSE